MRRRHFYRLCLAVVSVVLASQPSFAVSIDWVKVANPGNADDGTGYGGVEYVYWIGQYEVTNAQYAEFLNAVAATDTNALYNTMMGANLGGITRSGSPGSYTYSAIAGRENMPVVYVSFYDALRFANWLHNGQGSGDTETGAYTITAEGIANNSITRNAGATVFLPSVDEWYKAAYHKNDGVTGNYWFYPTGADTETECVPPASDTGNAANCWPATSPWGALTDVGAYSLSGSPYETFDQAGNVWEWNEAIVSSDRDMRGGSYADSAFFLPSLFQEGYSYPLFEADSIGFRVAMIPEPSTALLLAAGLAGLAAAGRKRKPL